MAYQRHCLTVAIVSKLEIAIAVTACNGLSQEHIESCDLFGLVLQRASQTQLLLGIPGAPYIRQVSSDKANARTKQSNKATQENEEGRLKSLKPQHHRLQGSGSKAAAERHGSLVETIYRPGEDRTVLCVSKNASGGTSRASRSER